MERLVLRRREHDVTKRTWVDPPGRDAMVLDGDVALVDAESGEVVAFSMVALPVAADTLARMFRRVAWHAPVNKRNKAANEARLSGIVVSHRTFGFSYPQPLRRRYGCGGSTFDAEYPEASDVLLDAAIQMDELFAEVAPREHRRSTDLVEDLIAPCWRLGDTPWTSGIINNNASLPYHQDSGNIKGSWSAMLGARKSCDGGWLHLVDYDVWLTIPNGSVTIFDGQSIMHGVSPFRLTHPSGHRFTCVWYAKRLIGKCADSPEAEVLRAQQAATEAQDRQRQRARG